MSSALSSSWLKSVLGLVWGSHRSDAGSCLGFFLLGLVLRGVPELLVSSYPVGYETITYYAPAMLSFSGKGLLDVFVEFFRAGPLFYALMWSVVGVTHAHAFVILKVVGPLLYGGLLVSFFVFLRRGLGFEWKLAFVSSFLLAFQVAALRESWDRFRTVLGLAFLFWALTGLKSDSKHKWWFVGGLSLLTVLSREYVGLVLFVCVLGFTFWERRDRLLSVVSLLPALVVFAFADVPGLLGSALSSSSTGLVGGGFLWSVEDAFVIFLVCYLGLLPFVVAGWRRDRLVWPMVVWLLLGSFSVLFPFAVLGYQRWLMLLVFPFCVFAVWGFERLRLFSGRRVWLLVSVVLAFVVVGAGYSSGAFSYLGLVPNSYVAVNLVQSSIGWGQVDDVMAVLSWLDRNAVVNSSVLVEECFYGWTLIYLDRAGSDLCVVPYGAASSPLPALEKALEAGFGPVYLIWFSDRSVRGFQVVYSWNAVSVFEYVS